MKGEILFEKMTGISEEYITEAALVPALGESPAAKPESRFAALSRALNSGLGVACICFLVAIATVVGMVAWGRMGDPIDPYGPGSHPTTQSSFSFHYGDYISGPVQPGTILNLETWVVNEGEPFTFEGSPGSYAPTAVLIHTDTGYRIEGTFFVNLILTRVTVNTGDEGRAMQEFIISADAPTGVYDLQLSYGEAQQRFSGVITVAEKTVALPGETVPPLDNTDIPLSFGYEPYGGDPTTGSYFHLETWVINNGAPFTFEGSSMGFAPDAVLVHMESGYRIKGYFDVTTDIREVTVNTGDEGRCIQEFFIPADAPTGNYRLVLSFDGMEQTFEKAVNVAKPIVEQPAILYNLTMPIGSNWLYEPIDEAYADGEEVTVRIKFATDVGTLFFLNGEVIDAITGNDQMGYWEYSFIMPQKDSEIIFQTYDGTAPYSDILKAYYTANPTALDVLAIDYGTYGDGVRVSILYDDRFAYTDMVSEQRIGPAVIRYADSNIMQALHDGVFCSLSKAYETGLLSDADLTALENLQRKWNPHLYADGE